MTKSSNGVACWVKGDLADLRATKRSVINWYGNCTIDYRSDIATKVIPDCDLTQEWQRFQRD